MSDILGIDIGGTFTDFVLLHNGSLTIHKLLSTPHDPAQALLDGTVALGAPPLIVHGTTVATNALLERRGAPTALITTLGFKDVLAIGRGDRPTLYDLQVTRPEPLVPEQWRYEVPERMLFDGTVLLPLEDAELARVLDWLCAQPVDAVAICLLHSYANASHEQRLLAAIQEWAAAEGRALFVCASHRVLPEQREFERTSTTVVNAYVGPGLGRYLERLGRDLAEQGVRSLRIMASDGGSMGLATARELPARATLSGPAGGVVGARYVARLAGFPQIVTFDMGGTSTDVALCDDMLPQGVESRVGGMPVRLPSLDIHTVGAGGGSLARIDAGGALRVGPQSAGADPGPACYGRGTQPTVTDANLVLGRLQAQAFLGGRMQLDVERARMALAPVAVALGGVAQDSAVERAALGVVRVANAAMERAIRAISIERGEDPRGFTLVAFGGAGPLHAAYLADALGMRRVLVPRYPGVLSALGMLVADVTRDTARTLLCPLNELDASQLHAWMHELAELSLAALVADGETRAICRVEFALDLRYAGQSHELMTPLTADGDYTPEPLSLVAERFHTLHARRYGHALPDRPIEAVVLRVKAISARAELPLQPHKSPPLRQGVIPHHLVPALLADDGVPLLTALYQREVLLPGDLLHGPAIVTQLDATTVIPPGWQASVDAYLNLVLTVAEHRSHT